MLNRARPAAAPTRRRRLASAAPAVLAVLVAAGCGGGDVDNDAVTGGQKLSFAYFQRCINPIFLAQLQIGGSGAVNTCAGSGCHANATGSGGAFRVVPEAQAVDLTAAANTPDVVRASDMYKNFYSAQGEVVVGAATQSRLYQKPLLLGVLHGGGQIFAGTADANARLIAYWISHPSPAGQDEFSSAGNALFTPPDANTGACNTQ